MSGHFKSVSTTKPGAESPSKHPTTNVPENAEKCSKDGTAKQAEKHVGIVTRMPLKIAMDR